jgi:hypothetical protein
MDEICKLCANYIKLTFLNKTIECCAGNVNFPKACSLREDLYKMHTYLCCKKDLCKCTGIKEEKLLRLLCRAEFAHIKKFKKDKKIYFSVTQKDIDELKKFK